MDDEEGEEENWLGAFAACLRARQTCENKLLLARALFGFGAARPAVSVACKLRIIKDGLRPYPRCDVERAAVAEPPDAEQAGAGPAAQRRACVALDVDGDNA